MRKIWKYSIGIVIVLLVIWFSLDIQNLDKHRAATTNPTFNAVDYAARFWNDSLPVSVSKAPQATDLLKLLNANPEEAFKKYGRKLGISHTWYFMLKGKGTIEKVEDEYVLVRINDQTNIEIATDFIFGNAVRDGSGKVNINEFLNMTDFNNVSVEIDKLVKEKVVSRLKKTAQAGMEIEFAGAIELNKENPDLSSIQIIPVSAKLSDGKSN